MIFHIGANVAILAKSDTPHPKLPGTIQTAVEAVKAAGGNAIGIKCDIRDEEQVKMAVEKTIEAFGGIDILINNASALSLTSVEDLPMKRYDLMHAINGRGTYMVSKYCLPHLKKSENAQIMTISPPLDMINSHVNWFDGHIGYTMAKYNMTLCTYGMSEEFKKYNIGCSTLWPRTAVATAAVKNLLGGDDSVRKSRTPEMMADAAHIVLTCDNQLINGKFMMDDHVLASAEFDNFDKYKVDPSVPDHELIPDLFC